MFQSWRIAEYCLERNIRYEPQNLYRRNRGVERQWPTFQEHCFDPVFAWGSTPEPPKILSPKIKPRHDGIQVDDLCIAVEGVVPVQQDVAPRHRRNPLDQGQCLGVATRPVDRP